MRRVTMASPSVSLECYQGPWRPMRYVFLAFALTLVPALAGCLADEDFPPGQIVAFGDSYTEGTGASPEEAYPALLSDRLGIPVLNAGVNGETAMEAMDRIERDVLRHEPRLVIVEFGVNEAFRGYPVQRALDGQRMILETLAANDIPAIIVGVEFWDYQDDFSDGLRDLGREFGAPVITDVLAGVLEDEDTRSDRYHPNAAGYAIMESRIQGTVRGVLHVQDAADP